MEDKDRKEKMLELIRTAKRAFDAHLQTGTGGNISIRLKQGDSVAIKPSGVGFCECSLDNLLVVDLNGTILSGSTRPSKDMPFHLGIYRVRPEVQGIVHVHSPWATAWAALGEEIPTLTAQAKAKLGRIPIVPSGPDGSKESADCVIEAFRNPAVAAAILASHGAVGVGETLLGAEQIIELVEETAHIAAVVRLMKGRQ